MYSLALPACLLDPASQVAEAKASFHTVLAANSEDVTARQGLLELYKRVEDYSSYCDTMVDLCRLPAVARSAGETPEALAQSHTVTQGLSAPNVAPTQA